MKCITEPVKETTKKIVDFVKVHKYDIADMAVGAGIAAFSVAVGMLIERANGAPRIVNIYVDSEEVETSRVHLEVEEKAEEE